MMRTLAVLLFSLGAFAQWTQYNVGTDASFRGLVAGGRLFVASGTKGTIAMSRDGGQHWEVLHVPGAEKLDLRGIQICGGDCLVVISSGPAENGAAKIFRTTDMGKSWNEVWSTTRKGVFLDAIQLRNTGDGFVLGDPVDGRFYLLQTRDFGASWTEVDPAYMPAALDGEGAFAASNSSLSLYCGNAICFGTGGGERSRVFRSEDQGQHWAAIEMPIPAGVASAGIFSLSIWGQLGIAAGGDYAHPSKTGPNVALTHDGGRTWTAVPQSFAYRSGASYAKGSYVVVGPSGAERSTDEGKTWKEMGGSDWNVVENQECVVFAAGSKGKLGKAALSPYCF